MSQAEDECNMWHCQSRSAVHKKLFDLYLFVTVANRRQIRPRHNGNEFHRETSQMNVWRTVEVKELMTDGVNDLKTYVPNMHDAAINQVEQ